MERDDNVVVFGEDVGYFGGVFRCTAGPAAEVRHAAAASTRRSTSSASSAPRSAWRPTGCGPASRSSSPTTCIRPTTRSSRRRRACATARPASSPCPIVVRMPTGGGIFGGQTHSQSPEALFTHVSGLKTVVPSNPLRRQGPADRRDRGRRPGDLPRAEAALQRPVRRPSRPAGHAVVEASARRGARRPLHGAARQGRDPPRGRRRDRARLRHDGPRRRGGRRGDRHRRRDHRPAHAAAARPRRRSSRR